MVYVAVAQNVVILFLAWSLLIRERQHARDLLDVISSAEAERAELLSRIQRPDLIPLRPRQPREPNTEQGEQRAADLEAYRKVGTVQPMREAN